MCDKHRKFDGNQDRATKKFPDAVQIANRRAVLRGHRQRIVRHTGNIFRTGVWFIQDVEARKS